MHGGLLNQILCKVIQEEQPRGALRGFRGEVSPRPSYLDAARPRVGYAEQKPRVGYAEQQRHRGCKNINKGVGQHEDDQ